MKFILIFGPQAVGKMTVGQELVKITTLKLFHVINSLIVYIISLRNGTLNDRKRI